MRGRVSSYFVLSMRLGLPLGSLAAGALAQVTGIRMVFVYFGAGLLLSVLTVLFIARRRNIRYRGAINTPHPGK